jgi:hypothetical protein
MIWKGKKRHKPSSEPHLLDRLPLTLPAVGSFRPASTQLVPRSLGTGRVGKRHHP